MLLSPAATEGEFSSDDLAACIGSVVASMNGAGICVSIDSLSFSRSSDSIRGGRIGWATGGLTVLGLVGSSIDGVSTISFDWSINGSGTKGIEQL